MKIKILLASALLLFVSLAFGLSHSAFSTVSKDYEINGKDIKVANMPKVSSLDSIGACSGCSSSQVAQHYVCEVRKLNCSDLKPENKISLLSMIAWTNTNEGKGEPHETSNHTNIRFGGRGSTALSNAASTGTDFSFDADACYPFEKFANKYGDDYKAVNAMMDRLKGYYEKNQTEGSICIDCIKEDINKSLLVSMPAEQLKTALSKKTYGEFLYKLFFQNCSKFVTAEPPPKFNSYPQSENASYPELVNKIKDVLSEGRPLNLDHICLVMEGNKCKRNSDGIPFKHAVVITGYRKMCKASGECRDVFRVQNCWGEGWQKNYDDGWVDGKSLLESAIDDNGKYPKDMLAWYTKPNAGKTSDSSKPNRDLASRSEK